ncbi:DUF6326 family protein [Ferruginibacter sp.]|nr:hypothetical protein [Ferruginibacter sp.]
MAKNNSLEDVKINIKIKLSALWASVTLCYLYGDYFELYVPGKVEGLLNGKNLLNNPTNLFAATLVLAIPALMVCLSVILKPAISKWLNIIVAIFFTAILVLIAFTSISPWRTFYVFLAIVESVITSLIVWYAFKWPKHIKQ